MVRLDHLRPYGRPDRLKTFPGALVGAPIISRTSGGCTRFHEGIGHGKASHIAQSCLLKHKGRGPSLGKRG